jgi:hypothetical protein
MYSSGLFIRDDVIRLELWSWAGGTTSSLSFSFWIAKAKSSTKLPTKFPLYQTQPTVRISSLILGIWNFWVSVEFGGWRLKFSLYEVRLGANVRINALTVWRVFKIAMSPLHATSTAKSISGAMTTPEPDPFPDPLVHHLSHCDVSTRSAPNKEVAITSLAADAR